MKTKLIMVASSLALMAVSNGAISLAGTALKNVQGSAQTDLASGQLGLIIVDTGGDGFLNGLVTSGNPLTGISLTPEQAGLNINTTFGGDLVVGRLSTASAFGDTSIAGSLPNFDASAFLNMDYAIVWFDGLASSTSDAQGSGNFGIARGADWTFPSANTGNFTFGTGATNLDQITLGDPSTAAAGQGVAFATNGTTLTIVPEPSTALLGVIGVLGLLRRRRI